MNSKHKALFAGTGRKLTPAEQKAKAELLFGKPKTYKITTHHQHAESEAQKADPFYEMSDRPHLTRGHEVYQKTINRFKKN